MINPVVNRILLVAAVGGIAFFFKSEKGKQLLSGLSRKSKELKGGHDQDEHEDKADHEHEHEHEHGKGSCSSHKKTDAAVLSEAKSKLKSDEVTH